MQKKKESKSLIEASDRNKGTRRSTKKMSPSESEGESSDSEGDVHPTGIKKFKGLAALDLDNQEQPVEESQGRVEEENEAIEKARFERLQRIAGYPIPIGGRNEVSATLLQSKEGEQPSKGVVFRKRKQLNSNILRQQSIDNWKQIKIKQSSMLNQSLAQVKNSFSPHEKGTEDGRGSKKMDLFGDEEDDEIDFKVKKQYEGKEGQRLLQLKGQWAFDERFNIDERFQEKEEEEDGKEKQQQMNILSDVLGTNFEPLPKNTRVKSSSVLVKRYDPELDVEIPSTTTSSCSSKAGEHLVQDNPPPEPIRSTEPATYKTSTNLKSLFSSKDKRNESGPEGFSLLANFGDASKKGTTVAEETGAVASTSTPRTFWESNPFKYDSSDDEDEQDTKPNKKIVAIPKCSFFFKKNDARFAGLQEYFLSPDEMIERVDYSEKRRELRSIVKAKARNAKRKDEKRTLAIKRAIRKKKKYRKTQIKKANSTNFTKLGTS